MFDSTLRGETVHGWLAESTLCYTNWILKTVYYNLYFLHAADLWWFIDDEFMHPPQRLSLSLCVSRLRACAFHRICCHDDKYCSDLSHFARIFFGPCSESSARASSSWFDLRSNAEHVTVTFVNSMHTHPVCVRLRQWFCVGFWIEKIQSFIYTLCVLFSSPLLFDIFH